MNFRKKRHIIYLSIGLLFFLEADSISKGIPPGREGAISTQGKIEFIKDLSLKSNKNDEKTSFLSADLIDADSQGNIYVFSGRERKIQVYDSKGVYLRTVGKRGQGPDEYEIPLYIVLDKSDNLYIFDFMKAAFLKFDSRGRFVDVFSTQGKYKEIPGKIVVDSQENIILGSTFGASDSFKISKFNEEFELLADLYVKKASFYNTRYIKGRMIGPPRYAPTVIWTMDDKENLYACYNKYYEIDVYSPSHKIIRKITNAYTPEEVPKSEIENEISSSDGQLKPSDFPKQKPAIYGLYIVKDYLFALTIKRNALYFFDVFDKNGNLIRKTSLDFLPLVYKNGYVYSRKYYKDPEDCEVLRYKVKIS
jgi:hypothetical protein